MQNAHIVVVGSTMIDTVTYSKVIPNAGETVIGDNFITGFGGKGRSEEHTSELQSH